MSFPLLSASSTDGGAGIGAPGATQRRPSADHPVPSQSLRPSNRKEKYPKKADVTGHWVWGANGGRMWSVSEHTRP